MTKETNSAPEPISFGRAGLLYVGPDAEVRQGCEAIMEAIDRFWRRRGALKNNGYEKLVAYIEERAESVAPIAANTPIGVQAKARVVSRLAGPGMAMYAARIMAASLASDLLGRGA
jgi:hypothetical protein